MASCGRPLRAPAGLHRRPPPPPLPSPHACLAVSRAWKRLGQKKKKHRRRVDQELVELGTFLLARFPAVFVSFLRGLGGLVGWKRRFAELAKFTTRSFMSLICLPLAPVHPPTPAALHPPHHVDKTLAVPCGVSRGVGGRRGGRGVGPRCSPRSNRGTWAPPPVQGYGRDGLLPFFVMHACVPSSTHNPPCPPNPHTHPHTRAHTPTDDGQPQQQQQQQQGQEASSSSLLLPPPFPPPPPPSSPCPRLQVPNQRPLRGDGQVVLHRDLHVRLRPRPLW